jgi:hypothetical protein
MLLQIQPTQECHTKNKNVEQNNVNYVIQEPFASICSYKIFLKCQ